MKVTAKIAIDDDRWAKHPYGVKFDDARCDREFGRHGLDSRYECYKIIEKAKASGYDIDSNVDEYFY